MATQPAPLTKDELALIKAAVAAAASGKVLPTQTAVPVGDRVPLPLPTQQSLQESGRQLLQQAADGHADRVQDLIRRGAPFATDWLGTSPLHMAAMYGHHQVARVLLEAGISRDSRTKVDKAPLHLAATEGFTGIVEMLLRHGAEVNCRDMLNMTPLHWAVERAHIQCIEWMLRCGADVDIKNKFDKTPHDIACDNGYPGIMEMLDNYEVYRADNPLANQMPAPSDTVATQDAVNSILPELGAHQLGEEVMSPTRPQPPPAPSEPLTPDQSGKREAMRLLASHGITMLPVDDASTVPAGLASGKTISLTAAGELALSVTRPVPDSYAAAGAPRTATVATSGACAPRTAAPAASANTANATASTDAATKTKQTVKNGNVSKVIKLTPEQFAKLTGTRPGPAGGKALSLKLPLTSLKKTARPADGAESAAKRLKLVPLNSAAPTASTSAPDSNDRLTSTVCWPAPTAAAADSTCRVSPDSGTATATTATSSTTDVATLRARLAAAEEELSKLRQLCAEKEADVERCRRQLDAVSVPPPH